MPRRATPSLAVRNRPLQVGVIFFQETFEICLSILETLPNLYHNGKCIRCEVFNSDDLKVFADGNSGLAEYVRDKVDAKQLDKLCECCQGRGSKNLVSATSTTHSS